MTASVVVCPACAARLVAGDAFCRHCGGRLGFAPGPPGLAVAAPPVPSQPTPVGPLPPATSAAAEPRPLGPPGVGVAFLGFGLGVGLAYALPLLLRLAGRPGGNAMAFGLSELGLWIPLVAAVLFVSRRRGSGRLADDFGWRIRGVDAGTGALGAIVGRSTTVLVTLPLYAAFHDLLRDPHVGLPLTNLDTGLLAVYAVTACLGAPIVEELFFRGLIQSRLVHKWGTVRGITVTALLFGAAHLIGWQGPGSLLAAAAIAVGGGGVLGYLKERTGRLGTSMVAHSLFNLMVVVLLAAGVAQVG